MAIRGLCDSTDVAWSYYLQVDDLGNIYYEGYLGRTKIEFKHQKWSLVSHLEELTIELDVGKTQEVPIGKKFWSTKEFDCNKEEDKNLLTFSTCEIGKEVTCSTFGDCKDVYKICDSQTDCKDESDEKDCELRK